MPDSHNLAWKMVANLPVLTAGDHFQFAGVDAQKLLLFAFFGMRFSHVRILEISC